MLSGSAQKMSRERDKKKDDILAALAISLRSILAEKKSRVL